MAKFLVADLGLDDFMSATVGHRRMRGAAGVQGSQGYATRRRGLALCAEGVFGDGF